jgi:hypothetical protein
VVRTRGACCRRMWCRRSISAVTGCVRPGGTSCLLLTQDRRQGPRSGDDLHPFFSGGWAAGGHDLPILPSPGTAGAPSCGLRLLTSVLLRHARRGHAVRPTGFESGMDSRESQQIKVCSMHLPALLGSTSGPGSAGRPTPQPAASPGRWIYRASRRALSAPAPALSSCRGAGYSQGARKIPLLFPSHWSARSSVHVRSLRHRSSNPACAELHCSWIRVCPTREANFSQHSA